MQRNLWVDFYQSDRVELDSSNYAEKDQIPPPVKAMAKKDHEDIFASITAPENSFYNGSLNAAGKLFSTGYLWPTLLNANLFKSMPKLKAPAAYFIAGMFDQNTNSLLVKRYYDRLLAAQKN